MVSFFDYDFTGLPAYPERTAHLLLLAMIAYLGQTQMVPLYVLQNIPQQLSAYLKVSSP
jgi:hypothetical protein